MICAPAVRPLLDIPREVWSCLAERDFVNFSVPLMSPPYEAGGRLYWDGAALMTLSPRLAAFARFQDAEAHMPYDKIFRVIDDPETGASAQIYSIFFERGDDSGWEMMYRVMSVSRILGRDPRDLPGWADDGLPETDWMLSATDPTDWLPAPDYERFFCGYADIEPAFARAAITRELVRTLGAADYASARVKPLPDKLAVLAPVTARCAATLLDMKSGEPVSRFIMDDPDHLVAEFWRLSSKMFVGPSDELAYRALANDAVHFADALRAAREQTGAAEELTAAAFYC